jgi:UDP-N-acetylmuramoylalanine--D-glutamate ligase
MIGSILTESGINHRVIGNNGKPVLDHIDDITVKVYVIELSSYQLHYSSKLMLDIGVLLPIRPDHIDWHGGYDEYIFAKSKIARASAFFITSAEMFENRLISQSHDSPIFYDTQDMGVGSQYYVKEIKEKQYLFGNNMLYNRVDSLPFIGKHNIGNALGAIAATRLVGAHSMSIIQGLQNFKMSSHRLENLGKIGDYFWYNDSKATNPSSTVAAINCIHYPTVLLLGGVSKNVDLTELTKALEDNNLFYAAICFGKDAEELMEAVPECMRKVKVTSLRDAVKAVSLHTNKHDIVLFSPAAASFDEFSSYEDRGNKFKEYVKEIYGEA